MVIYRVNRNDSRNSCDSYGTKDPFSDRFVFALWLFGGGLYCCRLMNVLSGTRHYTEDNRKCESFVSPIDKGTDAVSPVDPSSQLNKRLSDTINSSVWPSDRDF